MSGVFEIHIFSFLGLLPFFLHVDLFQKRLKFRIGVDAIGIDNGSPQTIMRFDGIHHRLIIGITDAFKPMMLTD